MGDVSVAIEEVSREKKKKKVYKAEIKNNPNIMYLVHTAPIYCGRPDIDEDRYITSYWNANNDTWSNIYDGDIVLQWMPFKKVGGFNA